jgi:hypothetical protein
MSDGPLTWPVEVFLGYCDEHSRTDRALFHTSHIKRLYDLAGEVAPIMASGFVSMSLWDAKPLIDKARARLDPLKAAEREGTVSQDQITAGSGFHDPAPKDRIHIEFSGESLELLEGLRQRTGRSTRADVVRDALALYSWAGKKIEAGYTVGYALSAHHLECEVMLPFKKKESE